MCAQRPELSCAYEQRSGAGASTGATRQRLPQRGRRQSANIMSPSSVSCGLHTHTRTTGAPIPPSAGLSGAATDGVDHSPALALCMRHPAPSALPLPSHVQSCSSFFSRHRRRCCCTLAARGIQHCRQVGLERCVQRGVVRIDHPVRGALLSVDAHQAHNNEGLSRGASCAPRLRLTRSLAVPVCVQGTTRSNPLTTMILIVPSAPRCASLSTRRSRRSARRSEHTRVSWSSEAEESSGDERGEERTANSTPSSTL